MEHFNNIDFIDRTVSPGELQPSQLAYPPQQALINGQVIAFLTHALQKDALNNEIRLYQSMARAAACTEVHKQSWSVIRDRFPALPVGKERDWSLYCFWYDLKNLVSAAAVMHDVDIFIAYGRNEQSHVTGNHWCSPRLLETKQNAVLYEAFSRAVKVRSRLPSANSTRSIVQPVSGPSSQGTGYPALRKSPYNPTSSWSSPGRSSTSSNNLFRRSYMNDFESLSTNSSPSARGGQASATPPSSPSKSSAAGPTSSLPSKKAIYKTIVQVMRDFGVMADVQSRVLLAFAKEDEEILNEALADAGTDVAAILLAYFEEVSD